LKIPESCETGLEYQEYPLLTLRKRPRLQSKFDKKHAKTIHF
jgi:hypothetical protein